MLVDWTAIPTTGAAHATTATATTGAGEAVFGNRGLAEADLTAFAGVQAVAGWRACLTKDRVGHRVERASRFGADVHVAIAAAPTHACKLREGAAAKAIASVGRERCTHVLAELRLGLGAVFASERALIVRALDFGLERIAASAPTAVVIARAISEVEVAVGLALLTGLTADSGKQFLALVVVAGSEALGIVVVDETVSVVIDAVSAIGDAPGTFDNVTLSRAATRTDHPTAAARPEATCSSGANGPAASGGASGSDEGVAAGAAAAGDQRENERRAKQKC